MAGVAAVAGPHARVGASLALVRVEERQRRRRRAPARRHSKRVQVARGDEVAQRGGHLPSRRGLSNRVTQFQRRKDGVAARTIDTSLGEILISPLRLRVTALRPS